MLRVGPVTTIVVLQRRLKQIFEVEDIETGERVLQERSWHQVATVAYIVIWRAGGGKHEGGLPAGRALV